MTGDDKRAQRFEQHKAAARGLAWRAFAWIVFSLIGIGLGLGEVFGAGGVSVMIVYVAIAGAVAGLIALVWALWRQRTSTINALLEREDARAAEARSRFY
ncbi:MAG: hypothetical protein KC519_13505 [Anaerolineae bacterium]|nr:hypothetical protein [Anaerolineae bacterium]